MAVISFLYKLLQVIGMVKTIADDIEEANKLAEKTKQDVTDTKVKVEQTVTDLGTDAKNIIDNVKEHPVEATVIAGKVITDTITNLNQLDKK